MTSAVFLNSAMVKSTIVLVVSLILFTSGIGRSSIYILDESKNAQCAWEMMHSHDKLIPTFNGDLRTDKPPLHYYAMMIAYVILGKTAAAARFFSSLAGALFMMILFRFSEIHCSRATAFWTVLTLAGSVMWMVEFHLAVPDPYLILFLGSGLMSFYHFMKTRGKLYLFLMYISFSLGFMAKGPVALLLPVIIIILFIIFARQFSFRIFREMKIFTGILLFILITLPWYLLVHIHTEGEWTRGFFLNHNFKRFINTMEGHGGSFLKTSGYYATGMMPFIVFLPGIIREAWRDRKSDIILFSSLAVVVFIVFFSVSQTRLPNYAMPSFPFAAIITGHYLNKISGNNFGGMTHVRLGLWILLVITLLIPVALIFGTDLEPLLSQEKTLGLWFSFMPAGVIAAMYFEFRLKYRNVFIIIAFTFIMAGLTLVNILIPLIDRHNPVVKNLELLNNSSSVRYYQTLNPSFVFNYGQIERVIDRNTVGSFLSDSSNLLITSLKAVNENPDYWENYKIVYRGKDLFDSNTTVILKGCPDQFPEDPR